MKQELGFETIPFEIAPEFQSEVFEEESERGGARSSPRPRSGFRSPYTAGQGPGRSPSSPTRPKKPPVRKPRPSGLRRRGPWGVPYGLVSEPYSGQPAPSGSEDMRWVQSALNDVLGLRLPVDGIMDAATRSAVRSFQQREGLPVDGIVGPDTREALLRARSGKTAPPPDGGDQAAGTTAPDTEWEGEESLESFWDTLGSWWGGSSPGSSTPRPPAGLPPSPQTAPSSRPVLRRGSKGSAVTELQNRLAALGFSPGAADGIFGSLTEGAVKSFQRSRGIPADGIVGSQTLSKLGIVVIGTPSGTPSSGPSGGSGSIRYGKGWGGSEGVADAAKGIAASMGVPVTCQKRDYDATIRVGSNTGSDHYTGNTTAFATDFGVSGSRGDQLARAIATKYGIPQNTKHTIQVGDRRYRLQLLWRVSGHYDHVHLGIRAA